MMAMHLNWNSDFKHVNPVFLQKLGSHRMVLEHWRQIANGLNMGSDEQEEIESWARNVHHDPGILLLQKWGRKSGATFRVLKETLLKNGAEAAVPILEQSLLETITIYCYYYQEQRRGIAFEVLARPQHLIHKALEAFLQEYNLRCGDLHIYTPEGAGWTDTCATIKGLQLNFGHQPGVPSEDPATVLNAPTITVQGAAAPEGNIYHGVVSDASSADSEVTSNAADDESSVYFMHSDCLYGMRHDGYKYEMVPPNDNHIDIYNESINTALPTVRSGVRHTRGNIIYTSASFDSTTSINSKSLKAIPLTAEIKADAASMPEHHSKTYNNMEVYEILRQCRGNGHYITWIFNESAFTLSITYLRKVRHYKIRNTEQGLCLFPKGTKFPLLSQLMEFLRRARIILPIRGSAASQEEMSCDDESASERPPGGHLILQHPVSR